MTKDNSIHENIVLGLACMSGCYTIWMLANKAPQLVSGLLNGSPSMSRGDLLTPARQVSDVTSAAINKSAGVAGVVTAANNTSGGYNDVMSQARLRARASGKKEDAVGFSDYASGVKGTMGNLWSYGKTQMPFTKAWNSGQDNYRTDLELASRNKNMAHQAKRYKLDENGNKVKEIAITDKGVVSRNALDPNMKSQPAWRPRVDYEGNRTSGSTPITNREEKTRNEKNTNVVTSTENINKTERVSNTTTTNVSSEINRKDNKDNT